MMELVQRCSDNGVPTALGRFLGDIHVHTLSYVILRLQHMLLWTFSAGHCKALMQHIILRPNLDDHYIEYYCTV